MNDHKRTNQLVSPILLILAILRMEMLRGYVPIRSWIHEINLKPEMHEVSNNIKAGNLLWLLMILLFIDGIRNFRTIRGVKGKTLYAGALAEVFLFGMALEFVL